MLICRLHTTMIAALDVRGAEVKVRHCDEILFAGRRALEALFSMMGASFEAMAVCDSSTRIQAAREVVVRDVDGDLIYWQIFGPMQHLDMCSL